MERVLASWMQNHTVSFINAVLANDTEFLTEPHSSSYVLFVFNAEFINQHLKLLRIKRHAVEKFFPVK